MSLQRFHDAQADAQSGYEAALAEMRAGRKRKHWIWYIFPQLAGLGRSGVAQYYGIRDLEEACEYLRDPILRARYDEITAAVAEQLEAGVPLERLMGGSIDALKLASSVTLFSAAASRLPDEASSALARRCDAILRITASQGYPACAFTTEQLSHKLKRSHASIIYVSHRMEEIRRISDRVTVLRNGRNVMTKAVAETTLDEIVEEIVGKKIGAFERVARETTPGVEVVRCTNLTAKPTPVEANLTIRGGEIVGIAGLMGSGRTSLAKTIFGLRPIAAGEVRLKDRLVKITSPPDAMEARIAMIPEDRLTQGLVLEHSVADNMTLPIIDRMSRLGFVNKPKEKEVVADYIKRLRVKTASPQKSVRTLSGGNAQKVVLAKWLATDPLFLILDEPTAGVDIGSKTEIVDIIRSFADRGRAVLVISSEPAELLALSDRILVMAGGRIVREISSEEIEEWAAGSTDTTHRISLMEAGLQVAIQEANS